MRYKFDRTGRFRPPSGATEIGSAAGREAGQRIAPSVTESDIRAGCCRADVNQSPPTHRCTQSRNERRTAGQTSEFNWSGLFCQPLRQSLCRYGITNQRIKRFEQLLIAQHMPPPQRARRPVHRHTCQSGLVCGDFEQSHFAIVVHRLLQCGDEFLTLSRQRGTMRQLPPTDCPQTIGHSKPGAVETQRRD